MKSARAVIFSAVLTSFLIGVLPGTGGAQPPPPVVSLSDATIPYPGATTQVEVSISGADAIAAIDLTVEYDASVASATEEALTTPFSAECPVMSNEISPGVYKISFPCPGFLSGSGVILRLGFRGNALGTTALTLSQCVIDEDRVPCTTSDGRIQVGSQTIDEHKCAVAKTKAAGQYYECRMLVESRAERRGLASDFATCDEKLAKKFAAIEENFGEFCGFGNLEMVRRLIRRDSGDMACVLAGQGTVRRIEAIPDNSSIAIADLFVEPPDADPTVSLRNTMNRSADARCFYVSDEGSCTVGQEFDLHLELQGEMAWKASQGFGVAVPAVPMLPFDGSLVCVQLESDGLPSIANSLIASISDTLYGYCARDGEGIEAFDATFDFDFNLELDGSEYDFCPPGRAFEIETCWSQSPTFDFACQ